MCGAVVKACENVLREVVSSVDVECPGLKPCWVTEFGNRSFVLFRISFSRVFAIVDMRDIDKTNLGSLSYETNGESQGVAHFLSFDTYYRMIISCYDNGEKIKMYFE